VSPEESGPEGRRPVRSVTELAVELTIAWLKRVESTADGRDPKEVVQAMDEFFAAVLGYHRREAEVRGKEPASAAV
jgi:hypothetical protein